MCVCIYIYIHHSFFTHSSFDGHLDCFHVQAIANSAAMNDRVRVSFFGSGIAGLYGSFIPSF